MFIIFGLVPTNILRTEGLAAQAMLGSIIGSIVNIILDPVFIFGLKQGAAGAAIATVLGNMAADLYYMQSFMVMLTNHFLLEYGTDKVAAMGIALKANMLTALILVGFAFGGQPLVGYNYGAKNEKRLKEILKFAYLFEMGTGLGFAVLVSIFAPTVIRVFMNDPGIVNNGAMMLRYQQFGMMFMAVTLVSTCVCQSVGNASGALVLSISRQGVVYAMTIVVLSKIFGYTGVLAAQACADVLTAVMAGLIIRHIFFRHKDHNV